MKFIGGSSRDHINIELDGKIARFWGELAIYGFIAGQMDWVYPEERRATEEERLEFIKAVKKAYRKEQPRKVRKQFKIHFYNEQGKKIGSMK